MKTTLLVLTGLLAVAGASGHAQTPPAAPKTSAMMAGQQQMMASMQAGDRKLDDLLAQLNAARGNDRLDKLVAVVNALAAERKGMREMMAMHGTMMGTMMNRTAAPATGDDHSEHHPPDGK